MNSLTLLFQRPNPGKTREESTVWTALDVFRLSPRKEHERALQAARVGCEFELSVKYQSDKGGVLNVVVVPSGTPDKSFQSSFELEPCAKPRWNIATTRVQLPPCGPGDAYVVSFDVVDVDGGKPDTERDTVVAECSLHQLGRFDR